MQQGSRVFSIDFPTETVYSCVLLLVALFLLFRIMLVQLNHSWLLILCMLTSLQLLASEADDVEAEPKLERLTSIIQARGRPVRIVNPFGDVRLRHGGNKGVIESAAVIQQLDPDSWLTVRSNESGETIEITVTRNNKQGILTQSDDKNLPRCDLAVLIPTGSSAYVETTHGLAEARGTKVDIDMNTETGLINVRESQGAVQATSVHGDITVLLEENITSKNQFVRTVTGNISVLISPNEEVVVDMSTSGDFITHFSLDVSHQPGKEPGKIGKSRINGGVKRLSLYSKQGDTALRSGPMVRTILKSVSQK